MLGGEPTLYPGLAQLIRFAKKTGLITTLYSNGRKFADKEFANAIKKAGVDFVNISVQSASPRMHDSTTQVKGSLEETFSGIANCVNEKLNVRLMTVLAHKNVKTYESLIKKFLPINPLFVFFREVPAINCRAEKILPNRESARVIEKIFKYCKRKKAKAHFYPRMPLENFNRQILKEMIEEKAISNSCYEISR